MVILFPHSFFCYHLSHFLLHSFIFGSIHKHTHICIHRTMRRQLQHQKNPLLVICKIDCVFIALSCCRVLHISFKCSSFSTVIRAARALYLPIFDGYSVVILMRISSTHFIYISKKNFFDIFCTNENSGIYFYAS